MFHPVYCNFSELLNLTKLAMTHETLNLVYAKLRQGLGHACVAMSLVRWPQGDSSVPRETDGATASANKEVRKAQEHARR